MADHRTIDTHSCVAFPWVCCTVSRCQTITVSLCCPRISHYVLGCVNQDGMYLGPYPYTSDLLGLQSMSPRAPCRLPSELQVICSPLRGNWTAWRRHCPATLIRPSPSSLTGFMAWFRIGFDWTQQLVPAVRNSPSAWVHPEVVEHYLTEEINGRADDRPFPAASHTGAPNQPKGVIPKGHVPGKWRLITDLLSTVLYS